MIGGCLVFWLVSLARIFRINRLPNLLTHGAPRAPLKKRYIFHIEILDFVVALKKEKEAS